jgi:hypothetical protein
LRDYYRVPVAAAFGLEPVPLKLSPSDSAALARASEAGLDPEMVHKARVVNLSGGGIGLALVLERKHFKVFSIDTRCIMYLDFPTMDRPFNITGRVVHAEKLETGDFYLGMAFAFDDPVVQKHTEDQLQRVSVWLQREILRRERQE